MQCDPERPALRRSGKSKHLTWQASVNLEKRMSSGCRGPYGLDSPVMSSAGPVDSSQMHDQLDAHASMLFSATSKASSPSRLRISTYTECVASRNFSRSSADSS